ncbi:hypothetical protein PoB_000956000 [Plakobranchus ocellatus]|uniref:Uncharacterized protein n=1 Tax=Plakobranchus ocellatus TaxID=259542 RepID=A0AAV3YJZ1_9GAST|nr:hypothetical protein PoB_000956000 [Plakobranchus ocellatus]
MDRMNKEYREEEGEGEEEKEKKEEEEDAEEKEEVGEEKEEKEEKEEDAEEKEEVEKEEEEEEDEKLVHSQSLDQARAPMASFEPATDGNLMSGRVCFHCATNSPSESNSNRGRKVLCIF